MAVHKLRSTIKSDQILFDLQLEQRVHDKFYHPDICLLNVHQRLNHYALHFAKYCGRISKADIDDDLASLRLALVDTFVIVLAASNTLNLRLSEAIPELANASDLSDTDTKLAGAVVKAAKKNGLLACYAIYSSEIAKACESVDHLEAYPFREKITAGVVSLGRLVLGESARLGLDLAAEVRRRLAEVKTRSMFHGLDRN